MFLDQIDLPGVPCETAEQRRNLHPRQDVQTAVADVPQTRREAEPQQGRHAEHVVGRAARVGEVLGDAQPAAVIEQAVQHMGRLRGGGGDHLGVEGTELVANMGVEGDARFAAMASVDVAEGFAMTAGAEELALRARCAPVAPEVGERQRVGVALFANVPVVGPGDLAQGGSPYGLGHARQAEIDTVGEYGGEQDRPVLGGHAAALMRERGREPGPVVNLRQQVGGLDAGQEIVGRGPERLLLVGRVGLEGRDFQDSVLDGDIFQRPRRGGAATSVIALASPVRRASSQMRGSSGTPTGKGPSARRRAAKLALGIRVSSKLRNLRLPATQTSPARCRPRNSKRTQISHAFASGAPSGPITNGRQPFRMNPVGASRRCAPARAGRVSLTQHGHCTQKSSRAACALERETAQPQVRTAAAQTTAAPVRRAYRCGRCRRDRLSL